MGGTKTSRVEFTRIETGILGNCRTKLEKIDELADDIKNRGLIQNLVVWHKRMRREPHVLPDGREVWDRYILVAGNRRYAAVLKIREEDPTAFEKVSVTLLVGNEDDALFAQLAENLQREDLNILDLANAIYAMRNRGHTQATIAKRLSKSQAWVSRIIKLRTSLAEPVLKAVGRGDMPIDTALALCDLDEKAQLKALARFMKKLEAGDKSGASRDAKEGAGRPARVPMKVMRSRLDFLAERREGASVAMSATITLAEKILAWAAGTGEWPDELPAPPDEEDES